MSKNLYLPWRTEPDSFDWEAFGLACKMRRGPMGHWCGYVGIPYEHALFGKSYDDVDDIDVHGGLTYADVGDDHLGDPARWFFGFDCAHAGDLCPDMPRHFPGDVYRSVDYVKAQTECLASQLSDIGGSGHE